MFFSLILENAVGDKIDMTATANQYMTYQIEGLSPPSRRISLSFRPDALSAEMMTVSISELSSPCRLTPMPRTATI